MNRSSLIFVGLLVIFLTSFLGLVVVPTLQVGTLSPDVDDVTKDQTPQPFSGLAEQGRAVYAGNGCVYCHSQQVRSRKAGADLARGWGGAEAGARRTVARDYLRDRAAYPGESRMGPDLANVGLRHDKIEWFLQHEYNPAVLADGATNCPPMRFLYDRRPIAGQPATDALPAKFVEDLKLGSEEVVPSYQAKALAYYLMSLKRSSYKLPEAPEEPAEP